LVVDLGANFAYFTTYSAAMGCRVKAVEAQPRIIDIDLYTLKINGLSNQVEFYNRIISSDPDAKLKINYSDNCWACSYVEEAKPGEVDTPKSKIVKSITVDEVAKEDVLLMKIDIEGFEVHALESAKNLLSNHKVEHIVMEWNPHLNSHAKITKERALRTLLELNKKYVIRHYDLRMPYPKTGLTTDTLPIMGRFWELTEEHLEPFNTLVFEGTKESNLWLHLRSEEENFFKAKKPKTN